jgi:hypothetical protein
MAKERFGCYSKKITQESMSIYITIVVQNQNTED